MPERDDERSFCVTDYVMKINSVFVLRAGAVFCYRCHDPCPDVSSAIKRMQNAIDFGHRLNISPCYHKSALINDKNGKELLQMMDFRIE